VDIYNDTYKRICDSEFLDSSRCIRVNKLLQKAGKVGYWEWDLSRNAFFVSDEMYKLYGIDREALEVSSLDTFLINVPDNDRKAIEENIESTLQTGQPYNLVHSVRLGMDNKQIRIHGTIDRDQNGITMYGTAQDISEIQKASDSVVDNSRMLLRLIDHVPLAIISTDSNGTILHANNQAERLTGRRRESISGNPIANLFHGGEKSPPQEIRKFLNNQNSTIAGEVLNTQLVNADSTVVPVIAYVARQDFENECVTFWHFQDATIGNNSFFEAIEDLKSRLLSPISKIQSIACQLTSAYFKREPVSDLLTSLNSQVNEMNGVVEELERFKAVNNIAHQ
jgi:PAS domain S-box-containing protein